jgi:hypothetical protein
MTEIKSILLTKEAWMSSCFSVAKFSGGITVTGEGGKRREFFVVNKEGKTLMQVVGIPAGEPADLVDKEFIPLYKKLGREKFIEIVKDNPLLSREELKNVLSEAADKAKAAKKAEKERKKAAVEAISPSLDFQD